jgi:UDP-N-acetylglucosamine 2-epimerase
VIVPAEAREKIRVLVVFGTRPEAIKLAPVIAELRRHSDITTTVCVTGQHREMLAPILDHFEIHPDMDLQLMTPDQSLSSLTAAAVTGVEGAIEQVRPTWLVVQGDTTTTMAATLAGFYQRVRIAHVEAGLRTYDLARPFPEEANRRIADALASLYFAPTVRAQQNLLREGVEPFRIHVTGNTGIDTLLAVVSASHDARLASLADVPTHRRIVLVTAHRRESFGEALRQLCRAIRELADSFDDVQVVYPVHLNPNVQMPVRELLGGHPRISLIPPLDYIALVHLMQRSTLILTDSGGIQEEAPSLGKPILVLRETTERPEGVEAGCARLIGTDRARVRAETLRLLDDPAAYAAMARVANPYGDGRAAERIVAAVRAHLGLAVTLPTGRVG